MDFKKQGSSDEMGANKLINSRLSVPYRPRGSPPGVTLGPLGCSGSTRFFLGLPRDLFSRFAILGTNAAELEILDSDVEVTAGFESLILNSRFFVN